MVTEAGKELLRNTINTAKFHNRILEENDMWKQWELECGLTMMVSDDDILKRIRKSHVCSKHRKQDKSKEWSKRDTKLNDPLVATAGPSRADCERWDHSGFQKLYPHGVSPPTTSKADSAKWDHSGFHELYPEKSKVDEESSSKSQSKKQRKKKKRKHSRRSSSSSDDEILEDFKKYRQSKADKRNFKPEFKEISSGYDSHIKDWKRMKHRS